MKKIHSLSLITVFFVFSTIKAQDNYLTFDGNNDYIALPISYNGTNAVPAISVEAWVRTSFTGTNYDSNWAIVDFDRSDFYDVYVRGDNGKVGFSTYAPTGSINDFNGNIVVNDGEWHHIAAIYDGTNKLIYVDGVLDASLTNPHGGSALGKNTTRFGFIGDGSEASSYNANKNNQFYDGDISELRIWNRVLSPSEIDANKLPGTLNGTETGLFAYYTFDNGAVNDLSPNGFDGGIFNGPVFNNTDGVPLPPSTGGGGGESLWDANGSNISYQTGNVGIGTNAIINYKLAVEGKIRTREVRVDQDTWPDYVFEKDYNLPTLEEIQKHITENGHLPNIPSAKEVEENGLELGEMNKLLLEKIEELTLYTLKQQKELQEQKELNNKLIKRIERIEKNIKNSND